MQKETKEEVLDEFAVEVKKIEEEAEQILKDANVKKEEIIAHAKTESVTMISKKQEELEKKKEDKLKAEKDKLDEEKEKLIKKGEKEAIEMAKSSRKNVQKAVETVLKMVDERIEE